MITSVPMDTNGSESDTSEDASSLEGCQCYSHDDVPSMAIDEVSTMTSGLFEAGGGAGGGGGGKESDIQGGQGGEGGAEGKGGCEMSHRHTAPVYRSPIEGDRDRTSGQTGRLYSRSFLEESCRKRAVGHRLRGHQAVNLPIDTLPDDGVEPKNGSSILNTPTHACPPRSNGRVTMRERRSCGRTVTASEESSLPLISPEKVTLEKQPCGVHPSSGNGPEVEKTTIRNHSCA